MKKVAFELNFEGFIRFAHKEMNGKGCQGANCNRVSRRKVGGKSF